ncbi:CheR family methyltransferase [Alicyclobacillus acidoterrestris]|uniref:protein-glutamate O-methyltransferase n=1 Tax=Alicyclobacillus acidoterrestris (strain ATCC 49025 / DSM 3922 / CIP 106132 / NCIMB 13137 / GD3B) TaxID=1356854 RepID=T0CYN9_ALIAG|nr:protein-glutamate O-methyltransferase CheR [Alicyclobacillus acidoterrestris]EPZ42666.1 hypothetical protein N007_14620 [Alicyclobacillus acidoterrestris ATCC 49025]UNO47395.1 protein-glutamate O-methyltransferase CheR [Alicyclobacillus acidoterrestris]
MDEFAWFMEQFRLLTGIDLTRYKRPQMERRLTNLRDRRGYRTFPEYIEALKLNRALMDELLDKMTINVSEFFRNPERWTQLRALLSAMGKSPRVWSAACASGEEPYSLAMLLLELGLHQHPILATDIDERVLQRAEEGIYAEPQIRGIDQNLLDRYFLREADMYRIREQVRKQVQFVKHNLLVDDYPQGLDLIVCRNVLIYFTDQTKQQILERFCSALNPGGILFVGSTEQFLGMNLGSLSPVAPFMYQKAK